MAYQSFIPARDADLLVWGNNFASQLAILATQVGITAQQAIDFETVNAAWVGAYTVATNSMTRSPGNIILKDEKRAAMVALARQLAGVIQKHPGTTDSQRADLGINVPKPREQKPLITESPVTVVAGRNGNEVTVELRPMGSTKRGRPAFADGAILYTAVGEQMPASPDAWSNQGVTGKTLVRLEFDENLPAGTRVWITAQWFNTRSTGPGSAGISTVLAGGTQALPQSQMKLAA